MIHSPPLFQSCPVRMTCNRLVPAALGTRDSSSLRLLPSEHMLIMLPRGNTCNIEDRFAVGRCAGGCVCMWEGVCG